MPGRFAYIYPSELSDLGGISESISVYFWRAKSSKSYELYLKHFEGELSVEVRIDEDRREWKSPYQIVDKMIDIICMYLSQIESDLSDCC